MCHSEAIASFPPPAPAQHYAGTVDGFVFGSHGGSRIAILPDIYGCNDVYKGLATHLANRGSRVYLVDIFAGLGHLTEATREAAFARRQKVSDKAFVDRFEQFVRDESINSVIGFCLGGLYVFELARRGVKARLLGLYGFPQGLANNDPLPVPFDYLSTVSQPFTMLLGAQDESVGTANIEKLEALAPSCPAMTLTVYPEVGHNFLPLLDSDITQQRAVARNALDQIEATVA